MKRGTSPELFELRKGLKNAPSRRRVSEDELAAVEDIARLRNELATAVGAGAACGRCVRENVGGLCCRGKTEDVFNDEELDLLRLLGARPRNYTEPAQRDAPGCVFLSNRGCSLSLDLRPTVCLHYICGDLMKELASNGRAIGVSDLRDQLASANRRYVAARRERLDEEEFREVFGM